MRVWWLALLLSIAPCALVQAGEAIVPGHIHLVSEVWEDFTNADGSGAAWEVFNAVFEPAGVKISYEMMPYTRSVGLVERGQADAWVGAYRDEVKGIIYPQYPFSIDRIYAFGRAESPIPTLDNLGDYRLIWMRGYDYQNQLPNVRTYQEVVRREGVIDMIKLKRADYYIDDLLEINRILNKAADPEQYRITRLTSLPLYLGFAPTQRGRQLAALYDRRLEMLIESGELRPIYQRWNLPYPFEPEPDTANVAN